MEIECGNRGVIVCSGTVGSSLLPDGAVEVLVFQKSGSYIERRGVGVEVGDCLESLAGKGDRRGDEPTVGAYLLDLKGREPRFKGFLLYLAQSEETLRFQSLIEGGIAAQDEVRSFH